MYSKKFTLQDIFYNKDLKDYIPQARIRTKGLELSSGKQVRVIDRVSFDDYIDQIITIAKRTARKSMKNVKGDTTNDYMVALITGQLRKGYSINQTYNDVLMALRNNAYMVSFFYSNKNKIEDVMEQDALIKHNEKRELYLRINSLEEIKSFDRMEMAKFLKDIMENLYFDERFTDDRLDKGMFIKNARGETASWRQLERQFLRKVGKIK